MSIQFFGTAVALIYVGLIGLFVDAIIGLDKPERRFWQWTLIAGLSVFLLWALIFKD